MGAGQLIYWGIGMLILVPVIMGFIGGSFGEDVLLTENQNIPEGTINTDIDQETGFFSNLWNSITSFIGTAVSGLFDFLLPTNVYQGYALFPWWLNFFITVIPSIMLIRGIASTSA